jgi:DNA-binding NarL/FixJ family response regulator
MPTTALTADSNCPRRSAATPCTLAAHVATLAREHVYDVLAAGASGFLLEDVTAERLFDAVRVIASGEALLAPTVTRRLIAGFARLRPPQPRSPGL